MNYFLGLIEVYTTLNEDEPKEELKNKLNSQNSNLPKVNFKQESIMTENVNHLSDVTVRKLEKIRKSTKSIKKISHLSINCSRALSEISKNILIYRFK